MSYEPRARPASWIREDREARDHRDAEAEARQNAPTELDPEPWVSWGVRYATQVAPSCYFEPRSKYSPFKSDYEEA